jgi:hypothetical protein
MSGVEDTNGAGRRLFVGVGNTTSADPVLKQLKRAVSDVTQLAERLGELGLETVCVLEPDSHGSAAEHLEDALPAGSLVGSRGVLVLLWAGHAAPNGDTRMLRLLTAGEAGDAVFTIAPVSLAGLAARSSASQILILIDTCYSGDGTLDALAVTERAAGRHADGQTWTGVVASSQKRAVDGALVAKLLWLLDRGPTDSILRLRWSSYQAELRGDDLVQAVLDEWDEDRQSPAWHQWGIARPIMRNPLYRRDAPERIVEHLLAAARGGAQSERGNWFTGREGQLQRIVDWMGHGEPGLCLVTGPAGCGKSAIAGRVVSLSNREERDEIATTSAMPPAELDPGVDSVDAHVQARGMDVAACSQVLAEALGVVVASGQASHHDVLAWAKRCERPPVIVIDGLDEAVEEDERIATDLLAPLASYALVMVASRDRPAHEEGKTLLGLLGAPALPIDLGEDPGGTDGDIDRYVRARLEGVEAPSGGGAMDPGAVARAITTLIRESGEPRREGGFLLARVLTSQLRERSVDTTVPDWETGLATSVEQALFQDLEVARPLLRDGQAIAGAGRDLLAALAYSYGSGFPADDVWPAVAAAITDAEVAYERLDAFWALDQYRRYVTASGLDGQAVYRLHQRLADALRRDHDGAERDLAGDAAAAVLMVYEQFLQSGRRAFEHPYLWHYAWRHAVDGGDEGIAVLERLAGRDPALVPDVAAALNALGAFYSGVGRRADAVAPTERAVEIRQGLAAESPAFLGDLASSLSNLGIRYSGVGRRADAVAPTERAVEIYELLAEENPAFLNDLAMSLNNLGAGYSEVGRRADAVVPTERAVEIYEVLAKENPAFLNDLAMSLSNLGIRYSGVGRRADAVVPTERAVEIYEVLAEENPAFLNDLAMSLSNLGAFYSVVGRRADAVAPIERAVEIYEVLAGENSVFLDALAMSLNNLGNRYSEVGTPDKGPQRWTEVLARFAADPAAVVLRLGRSRDDDEFDEAVVDVLEAHAIDPTTNPELTAQLRAKARSVRERDPERFDARWSQAAGQPPAWLLLDDDTLRAAADWITTPTWSESRAFLTANADRLLSDHGKTALAELALASGGDPIVTEHERILQAAREHGIDEVYRPLLVLDTIDAWLEIEDLDDSQRFLIDHHDDLTTPDAAENLAEQNALVHYALATLARDGPADRAYELLQAPDELPVALAAARREGAPEQLHAIALLARAAARTGDQEALAAIHLAIALVLAGDDEQATQLTGQLAEPDVDTTPLIHALTDAIAHHPSDAPALAGLIRQLTSG